VIGTLPPEDALRGSFSGGASTSRVRALSHPALKFVGEAHVTAEALDIWNELIRVDPRVDLKPLISRFPELLSVNLDNTAQDFFGPHWPRGLELIEVPGNVLFTVPKKTDIDRCACKEPDINMFLQKGIGGYIRKRLLTKGVNLNDQSINQRLAREGSITGKLATLDLSAASDSVTRGLVELLLPPLWFTVMDALRCSVTVIDGEEHRNEMFSSMGNGFTFELESLIFWALGKTVSYFSSISSVVSVYGDDIIVHTDIAHDLVYVLSVFGFTTNPDKSFIDGPFRESCGGHYHNGSDITPFYIREPLSFVSDVILVANQLRQWSCDDGWQILNPEVEEIWLWLRGFIPECLWGGRDLSFQFALVTPDAPRKRMQMAERKLLTGDGGYFMWLLSTWDRSDAVFNGSGVNSSERSVETQMFRYRTNRVTVTRVSQVFLSEI
jgi:hypothetical protein